jgi:UDP-N-acetylmuramyl pentapeptide phosphotransferase/UDP-N-acetylglucosamine-1-phosphate transferase
VTAGLGFLFAIVVSPALCAWWISRARRLDLLDAPERRRLHEVPTPRGGGIGPVAAIALILAAVALFEPTQLRGFAVPVLLGLVLAAVVSAIDDHRELSVRVRLGVHVLAAGVLAVAFIALHGLEAKYWVEACGLLVIAIVASMNLHNFMDGSDAHLPTQALFVFAMLAALSFAADARALASTFAAMALALVTFLPFNWPRARVFLGDVGSISLGFLIAAASLVAIDAGSIGWGGALILSSGFMIDAAATLCGRMRRTRHWLSPHRDHLYQWLRRRGWPAARVVAAYQGWNLCVVVPALWLSAAQEHDASVEFLLVLAVHGLGLGVWIAARGALRRAHRAQ